jgi:predicted nucleic acid-binding protein
MRTYLVALRCWACLRCLVAARARARSRRGCSSPGSGRPEPRFSARTRNSRISWLLAPSLGSRPRDPRAGALVDQLAGPRERPAWFGPSVGRMLRQQDPVIAATGPRELEQAVAEQRIEDWLSRSAAWIPVPGSRHQQVLGGIVRDCRPAGNLVPDAHLAALALEHGLTVVSTDTDFARFPGVAWLNPVSARALRRLRRASMLTHDPETQHISNTSPGPEGIQRADNTDETALRGTRRHHC